MRKLSAIILILIIPVFLAGAALAQEKKAAPGSIQETCFIMKDNPVNPKIYADYKGYRIYFCCTHCLAIFKQDQEKWFQEMIKAKMPMEKSPESKK